MLAAGICAGCALGVAFRSGVDATMWWSVVGLGFLLLDHVLALGEQVCRWWRGQRGD